MTSMMMMVVMMINRHTCLVVTWLDPSGKPSVSAVNGNVVLKASSSCSQQVFACIGT